MIMKLKDDHWCFACGDQNPHGLHLDDLRLEDGECVCTFTPQRWHQGWAEMVHGGITATLLDEVMTHVLWRRGLDGVTAEMTVRLKRPVPVGESVTARGRIERRRGRMAEVAGELRLSDGELAATATAKFIVAERGPDEPGGPLSLAARSAVIFDMFGTLAPVFDREEYFATVAEMGRALGMEGDEFYKAFRADAPGRTTGKWATLEDNLVDFARRLRLRASPDDIARAARFRYDYTRRHLLNPYPDALATLEALRAAGRPVGLISDCSPEAPVVWPESPLAAFIPHPVFSPEAGTRKPDPRIYHLACERMGIAPYEAVYVGDGDSDELAGAAAVGLCPVLVDRGETSAFRTDRHCAQCEIIVSDLTRLLPLIGLEAGA